MVLADLVHRSGRTLADLAAAAMTRLPQVLVNVPVVERVPDAADHMADDISAAEETLGARGRVLLRCSGTEPLVRVMVEAFDDDTARSVADRLAGAVRDRWGVDGAVRT